MPKGIIHKGLNKSQWAEKFGVHRETFYVIVKKFGIEIAVKYKGKRPPKRMAKNAKKNRFKCYVDDIVYHDGKQIMVTNVVEKGSTTKKAYIVGCPIIDDVPRKRMAVYAGYDWSHFNIIRQ